jgi:hypothetical protein
MNTKFLIKKLQTFMILSVCLVPAVGQAFEKERWGYGGYMKAGSYSLDDKGGSTGTATASGLGLKVHFKPEVRGRRYFASVDMTDFHLKAVNGGNINAEVSTTQFGGGIEQRFNLARNFKIWLGAGLSLNTTKVDNRFSLTSDGFLNENIGSRKKSGVGVLLNADTYFDLSRRGDYQVGVGFYSDIQGSGGATAYGLKLTLQKK